MKTRKEKAQANSATAVVPVDNDLKLHVAIVKTTKVDQNTEDRADPSPDHKREEIHARSGKGAVKGQVKGRVFFELEPDVIRYVVRRSKWDKIDTSRTYGKSYTLEEARSFAKSVDVRLDLWQARKLERQMGTRTRRNPQHEKRSQKLRRVFGTPRKAHPRKKSPIKSSGSTRRSRLMHRETDARLLLHRPCSQALVSTVESGLWIAAHALISSRRDPSRERSVCGFSRKIVLGKD